MLAVRALHEHWSTIMDGHAYGHGHGDGAHMSSSADAGPQPACFALLPLLAQAEDVERRNAARLQGQITEQCRELWACKRDLEQCIEQNMSIALEFSEAGCAEIAREKTAVARVETALVQRLETLFGGGGGGGGTEGGAGTRGGAGGTAGAGATAVPDWPAIGPLARDLAAGVTPPGGAGGCG